MSFEHHASEPKDFINQFPNLWGTKTGALLIPRYNKSLWLLALEFQRPIDLEPIVIFIGLFETELAMKRADRRYKQLIKSFAGETEKMVDGITNHLMREIAQTISDELAVEKEEAARNVRIFDEGDL